MGTNRMVPLFVCGCCVVIFGAGAAAAQVRTWVSPTGSDANPCTLQQPCRNFGAAVDAVADGGEVVALSSGGFGPVTLTKAVALIAPEGVHAAIAPTTGNAVTINAPGLNDTVVLRNVYLNSQGAENGILATAVSALHVEGSVVSGFSDGVRFEAAGGRLALSDSVVRDCTNYGIAVSGGSDVRAVISNSQLHYNATGIRVVNARVAIRDTASTARPAGVAFWAHSGSSVSIDGSTAAGGNFGFYVRSSGIMVVRNCVASSNDGSGAYADLEGVMFVSHSVISGNGLGVGTSGGGLVRSAGENILQGNTTNGAFTNTFSLN